jgi:hypothetical protein
MNESKKKVSPLEIQLGMKLFFLVTLAVEQDYKDKLTHWSPEWIDVQETFVKKLELDDATNQIIINKGLESEKKLVLDFKDAYVNEDAAYERARDMNDLLKSRLVDVKTEYESSLEKLVEFEIFFEELKKTKLI